MKAFCISFLSLVLCSACVSMSVAGKGVAVLMNRYSQIEIGPNACLLRIVDVRTGEDYLEKEGVPIASVRKAGQVYPASSASFANGRISLEFGDSGASAVLQAIEDKSYFVLDVKSVVGQEIEEFIFADIQIATKSKIRDPLVGCALALNLKTKVPEIPGINTRLRAMCYPRFGFEGAKVALILCPRSQLRKIMQEVVSVAPDLPHSTLGGPWALDQEVNRGSYIFNFRDLTEATVDEWIQRAKKYGIDQIDFHGGYSFRFGDCQPNPQLYPNGRASLKAVVDRLHAAGIKAGLHPYAFFIAKDCPWVTPVPDPGLAKDATFTLAASLSPDATTVPVVESTEKMSTVTGFFVRNSVTIQVDNELITYTGISKQPPYAFTGCVRGAYGTRVSAHEKGAKVHHLKECFGLFAPNGDSELLTRVASAIASTYNECGFDMIYLDALDGEDVLGGPEWGWHYGSKFVFEICKHLKKPALMEMSTFHHHLWYVRSRMGAWDHPSRSSKRFIDVHCAANESTKLMFLPSHLGWWSVRTSEGSSAIQTERTYPDEIEYLMCKCIATDSGFSLTGFGPENPGYTRLAEICRQYEELRRANHFPESIKSKLRIPGDEYTLEKLSNGNWQLRQVRYSKHKVEGLDGRTNVWTVKNNYGTQPLRLRIEALVSAEPYDSANGQVIADFKKAEEFDTIGAQAGVVVKLESSTDQVTTGEVSGCFTATSTVKQQEAAWARAMKTFDGGLNISHNQALGVWIYGDGQGEILNVQLNSPEHVSGGIGDHYVKIDFAGWRYFELIETEGERINDYTWPYPTHPYYVYREMVDFAHVDTLGLWYNDLPRGKEIRCYISPIKALPLVQNKLRNPSVTVGGVTITFPVEMESGSWLEFNSMEDCKVYSADGRILTEVKPEGNLPELRKGDNRVEFICDSLPGVNPRACVTVISLGEAL